MPTLFPDAMACDDNDVRNLRRDLEVLHAVDAAHRSGQISTSMRYHILQNLFPPMCDRVASGRDFSECSTEPQRSSVVERARRGTGSRAPLSMRIRFPSC